MSKKIQNSERLYCDGCKWYYPIIDKKTRKVRTHICWLWLDGSASAFDLFGPDRGCYEK